MDNFAGNPFISLSTQVETPICSHVNTALKKDTIAGGWSDKNEYLKLICICKCDGNN
jgi:hypothetical protein